MRMRALVLVTPCLAAIVLLAVSGASVFVIGRPLLWPPHEVTLTEAIVLRDQAEMARQILNGADPNGRYEVVDVVRPGERYRLTPLEAAATTRELYMIEIVMAYGGVVDESNAQTLHCLARAMESDDIASYVAAIVPVSGSCEQVALPYR